MSDDSQRQESSEEKNYFYNSGQAGISIITETPGNETDEKTDEDSKEGSKEDSKEKIVKTPQPAS